MLAFPLQRAMLTLPKRCLIVSIQPDRNPTDLPIERIVDMKSGASPPKVSATIGTHSIPLQQSGSWRDLSSTFDVFPLGEHGLVYICAASARVRGCSSEVTWISRAAGHPLCQLGSKISAGCVAEPGTKLEASLDGARAAD